MTATLAINALLFFDQTAIVVALPTLHGEFHASSVELQWTITAFLLALATFMVPAGRVADWFGHRRMLLAGTALFGAASLSCALAPGLGFLVAARFVQGVGAAVMQPLALSAITRMVDDHRRGWAVGVLSTGGTTFLVFGPLIAGVILAVAGWRWLFVANLPVVGFGLVQVYRWLAPTREASRPRLDLASLALVVGGLAATVVGVSQLAVWGLPALAPLALGAAALTLFGHRQVHASHPLIPLTLLGRDRLLVASLAALVAIQFAVLGTTVYLVVLLQHGLGESAVVAGAVVALAGVGTPLLSMLTGRLTDIHGPRALVAGGLVLASCGLAWLASVAPLRSLWFLVPGLLLFSLSRPAVFTPASTGPLAALPERQRGLTGSLVTEARQLGAVLGVVVSGTVFAAVHGTDLTEAATVSRGFQAAIFVAAGVTTVSALVVLLVMPSGRGRAASPDDGVAR